MKIKIQMDEETLVDLIMQHIRDKLGEIQLHRDEVIIEVKSQQNYKSEWEKADFRATYESKT